MMMEDGMTDFRFKKVLQMIQMILEDYKDIEEAKNKIKNLMDEKNA